mmetsp:Transcript_24724/g.50738  ORF Transcript_24724/g.50738 Transcript_24724/m.50738 type:complete len:201 (+) Transcript_24724:2243-2845(+)
MVGGMAAAKAREWGEESALGKVPWMAAPWAGVLDTGLAEGRALCSVLAWACALALVLERAMALAWAVLKETGGAGCLGFALASNWVAPKVEELESNWAPWLAVASALRLGVGLEWMRARAKVAGLALELVLPLGAATARALEPKLAWQSAEAKGGGWALVWARSYLRVPWARASALQWGPPHTTARSQSRLRRLRWPPPR